MDMLTARDAFAGNPNVEVLSATLVWVTLRVKPSWEARDAVVGYFRTHLSIDLPNELCEQLCLAMDELLSNAIEHGASTYDVAVARVPISFSYVRTRRSIAVVVHDHGPGFSLNKAPHAAVNNPPGAPLSHVEHRSRLGLRPGGFGIMLVQQIADELIYNESGNQVMFIKYL